MMWSTSVWAGSRAGASHGRGGALCLNEAAATTDASSSPSRYQAQIFLATDNDPAADLLACQVRRAIIVGANHNVPSLQGKNEANGLLSASGALAAMANPDTTPPTAFRAFGPAPRFKLAKGGTVSFRWSASSDTELDGYKLTVNGKVFITGPGQTSLRRKLAKGNHTWSLRAYDFSDNETAASR